MENSVVQKLRSLLERGISEECHALYLLVEVRKLIEHDRAAGNGARWKGLNFYCDWVAHPTLKGKQARDFVSDINNAVRAVLRGSDYDPTLAEQLSLRALHGAMREMFEAKGLPTRLFCPDQWREFLMLFSQIASDCPCRFSSANPGLDYCDRAEPAAAYGTGRHMYVLPWKLFKSERQAYEWQFPVYAGDGNNQPSTFIEVGPAPTIRKVAFPGQG